MTMKLSEAIRMNGMMKPQGFGQESMYSPDAPCALGGALQSIGKQHTDLGLDENYGEVEEAWPWSRHIVHEDCPAYCGNIESSDTLSLVYHLNDFHFWTRSQIAAWVASVEPAEVALPHSQDEHTDGGPGPGELALEVSAS